MAMKKKTAFAFVVFSLLVIGNINAQVKKNIIKTSLVFPLGEVFELSWEHVVNTDLSFQLSGFTGGKLELGLMPELRYYLSETREAPDGVFVAPFLFTSSEQSGGGVMVGVQKLFKGKVTLDACLGPFITGDGVIGMGGINLGIAF
jgi:hypothetical protein